MLLDEVDIENARIALRLGKVVPLDHPFANAGDRRRIATNAHLMVLRTDARATDNQLQRILRVDEALEATLAQWVEGDNGHSALRRFLQGVQHARRIGRRVVTKKEDTIGMLEVLQKHRADGNADHLRKS